MKKTTLIYSFLLVFTLFFTINTYAAETTFPEIPQPDDLPYRNYIITSNSRVTLLYVFTSNDNLSLSAYKQNNVSTNTMFNFESNNSFNFYYYTLVNNNWVNDYENLDIKHKSVSLETVHYSSFDVYKEDKVTLFFQKTPMPSIAVPTLEETLAEEIPATANKIIQAMTTILLCGVGCLALLIGLPVLAKVFGRFRVK